MLYRPSVMCMAGVIKAIMVIMHRVCKNLNESLNRKRLAFPRKKEIKKKSGRPLTQDKG